MMVDWVPPVTLLILVRKRMSTRVHSVENRCDGTGPSQVSRPQPWQKYEEYRATQPSLMYTQGEQRELLRLKHCAEPLKPDRTYTTPYVTDARAPGQIPGCASDPHKSMCGWQDGMGRCVSGYTMKATRFRPAPTSTQNLRTRAVYCERGGQ